jgi:predicted amidohydrolase
MSKLTLACAQIECLPGDIAGNLAKHLAMIGDARSNGADLVVFPELSLCDYLSVPDTAVLARAPDAEEIRTIAQAADGLDVSFGFVESGADGRCYNSQALVSGGRIVHIHHKLNLPTYGNLQETLHYRPGERLETAALSGSLTAATLICADSWNPALPWLAALQRPDLLIQPIASARSAVGGDFDNPSNWAINLRHTAMTYGLPIVMTNHCGTRDGLDFWGGSRVIDAYGRELVSADDKETIVYAEIETADTARARELLPTIRDADPALIRAELERFLAS